MLAGRTRYVAHAWDAAQLPAAIDKIALPDVASCNSSSLPPASAPPHWQPGVKDELPSRGRCAHTAIRRRRGNMLSAFSLGSRPRNNGPKAAILKNACRRPAALLFDSSNRPRGSHRKSHGTRIQATESGSANRGPTQVAAPAKRCPSRHISARHFPMRCICRITGECAERPQSSMGHKSIKFAKAAAALDVCISTGRRRLESDAVSMPVLHKPRLFFKSSDIS